MAVGPDGAYYVGQLTGFPFPPGGASVFRIVPGEEPTGDTALWQGRLYASGFTNIIDVAFGPDGTLYVLEIAHDGLRAPTPRPVPHRRPVEGAGRRRYAGAHRRRDSSCRVAWP